MVKLRYLGKLGRSVILLEILPPLQEEKIKSTVRDVFLPQFDSW